jgi:hypothetical protein
VTLDELNEAIDELGVHLGQSGSGTNTNSTVSQRVSCAGLGETTLKHQLSRGAHNAITVDGEHHLGALGAEGTTEAARTPAPIR